MLMSHEKHIFVLAFGELLAWRSAKTSSIIVGTKSDIEEVVGCFSYCKQGSTATEQPCIGTIQRLSFKLKCFGVTSLVSAVFVINRFLGSVAPIYLVSFQPQVFAAKSLMLRDMRQEQSCW